MVLSKTALDQGRTATDWVRVYTLFACLHSFCVIESLFSVAMLCAQSIAEDSCPKFPFMAQTLETIVLQASRLIPLAAIAPTLALAFPAVAAIETPPVPELAKALPANTAYVVLLDTREETWQQLEQYAFFEVLEAQGEESPNPGGLPFLPVDLDYLTDIAPWVDDTVGMVLLPLERRQATVLEEHQMLIAPIAQPDAFTSFIDTVREERETTPETKQYQGVSILYWEPQFLEEEGLEEDPGFDSESNDDWLLEEEGLEEDPDFDSESNDDLGMDLPASSYLKALPDSEPEVVTPPVEPEPDVPGLAIAVVSDMLIAAEHPAAIYSWIDLQPQDEANSLAAQERFQRTLTHPNYESALGIFYGSMSEMVKYSLTDLPIPDFPFELPALPGNVSPQELAQLASIQLDSSVEVLLYPEPVGMRIQGRAYYDNTVLGMVTPFVEPAPAEVLDHIPAASYALLSGQNLADAWQQTVTTLAATEETADYLKQARAFFLVATGLDLDEEFFGWMDQGFSVFLFPTRQSPLTLFMPQLEIGLGLAVQTSDREAAEYAMAQLNERLGTGFATVQPHTLAGQTVSSWSTDFDFDGQLDSFLGYGWASEDVLVVTTSLGSLSEILNLSTRNTLPNSPIFRRATQLFPAMNQGYAYANISAIRSLVFSLFPTDPKDSDFADIRQLMGTLQAISGTLSATEDHLQLDGLLMMSPSQNSQQLGL